LFFIGIREKGKLSSYQVVVHCRVALIIFLLISRFRAQSFLFMGCPIYPTGKNQEKYTQKLDTSKGHNDTIKRTVISE